METLFAGYINARLDMYLDMLQDCPMKVNRKNKLLEPCSFEALIEIFPKSLYNGGRKCVR